MNKLLIHSALMMLLLLSSGCTDSQQNTSQQNTSQNTEAPSPESQRRPSAAMQELLDKKGDPSVNFATLPAEIEEADVSILFLGNSHTGMFYLSNLVERLMVAGIPDKKFCIKSNFEGGMQLTRHAKTEKSQKLIHAGKWDYVVLQGSRNQNTIDGAREIAKQVAPETKVVLYSIWGTKGREADAEKIFEAFQELADEIDAQVAPIGMVWLEMTRNHPDVDLYIQDGNHGTIHAAYLTACAFFAFFQNESPERLGMVKLDRENEELLDQGTRDLLEKTAWESIQKCRSSGTASDKEQAR